MRTGGESDWVGGHQDPQRCPGDSGDPLSVYLYDTLPSSDEGLCAALLCSAALISHQHFSSRKLLTPTAEIF